MQQSRLKSQVSLQAFVEEIKSWQLVLSREQKKLKTLRLRLKNKMHINQLDILVTGIDAQLIKYRKLKDINKIQGLDIIQEYNQNSKKFMDLMESLGNFADKVDDYVEQAEAEDVEIDSKDEIKPNKLYRNQTFTYSISKKSKYHKDGSPHRPLSKATSKKSSVKYTDKKAEQLRSSFKDTAPKNLEFFPKAKKSASKPASNLSLKQVSRNTGQLDAGQIRYQLKQIKSMMSQIQNQIKYHNHQDIEQEMLKIQHNNKRMAIEVKSLREDSQYIISRIQKLKEELAAEKQIQAQMIQQFERPQNSRRKKSKSIMDENTRLPHEDVSQWVKIRI